ncbi:MDH1 [Mytilus edulis]|uniref:Malate dehydrogenase, cytoplasmic n=1 Tax=Mytilus edulis TaxID=6550 RepID=A0A8S3R9V3_MYTED|nr:MDH1 [Mytilus edulis]
MAEPLRVLVTGAAGQIAYSLLYSVAKGDVFGPNQPIILVLLDIQPMLGVLEGVVMEMMDCALPLLREVIPSVNEMEAFKDVDVAMLVGAMPRREGMERKDLLAANVKIFKSMGNAIDTQAKKNIKVVVVGNPANTNVIFVRNMHHQYDSWLNNDFIKTVQQRGAAVIKARKLSSAMSAAKAIVDHVRDWWNGVPDGTYVSMAVPSDGSYNIEEGLIYSFPVRTKPDHTYEIVKGLTINDFSREKMDATEKELSEEKNMALSVCES